MSGSNGDEVRDAVMQEVREQVRARSDGRPPEELVETLRHELHLTETEESFARVLAHHCCSRPGSIERYWNALADAEG